ncbi:hypothetical protein E2C01_056715 [Portunus trituberculatus]|uniref:Uncharacterized protein n=1 Tax=Portunus trituberculatus TaxID=210409 RepID=A0A5B7GYH6_PORTR|nr:hypothetical protein [Portunus trituberculatus]
MPSSTICNLCDQICRSQLFPTPNQFQPTVAQPPSLRPSSPHSNSWNRPDGEEREKESGGEKERGEGTGWIVTFLESFQQVLESSEQVVSIQNTSRPYRQLPLYENSH